MTSTSFESAPIARGTSLYYALLFQEKSKRAAVSLLYHFFQKMRSIVQKSSEASIAKVKLNWWSKEISLAFEHQSTHPLSQALTPLIDTYDLPQAWFQQIINSHLTEVTTPILNDLSQTLDYCCDNKSALYLLISHIFNPQEDVRDFAISLGISVKLIELIRFFGKDYRHGKVLLPQQKLAGLELQSLDNAALLNFFKEISQLAKSYHTKALSSLAPEYRQTQSSLLILGNIALCLLAEMEQDQFQVLHQKYSLTPLRKYWIAWRTQMKAKKQQLLMI